MRFDGEILVGLFVGFYANLLVCAVLSNGWAEPEASDWLATLGVVNELVGVVCIGFPEIETMLVPLLKRAWLVIGAWWSRLNARMKRLLGFRTPQRFTLGTAVSSEMALPFEVGRGPLSLPPGSIEEQLRWLASQLQLHRTRLDNLQHRVDDMPGQWEAAIRTLRDELERGQREAIQRSADRRIQIRLLGLGYVVLGLLFSLIGNLV
jgi:hypothetical protein